MDWEDEGLLEGLEDDDARAAREELLDHLHDDGVSVDELKAAVKEERLVLLPVERFLAGARPVYDNFADAYQKHYLQDDPKAGRRP